MKSMKKVNFSVYSVAELYDIRKHLVFLYRNDNQHPQFIQQIQQLHQELAKRGARIPKGA